MKACDGSIDFDQISFDYLSVWIKLPGSKPRFWSPRNLSKVVSYIGHPIAVIWIMLDYLLKLRCLRSYLIPLHLRDLDIHISKLYWCTV